MIGTGSDIRVEDLTATYVENGVELVALTDVSFRVLPGEFVAIIGPSGCGKSTLLDIISGLIDPVIGRVYLDDQLVATEARLGRSAYMHQRDLLLPWRSALSNAALALEVQGVSKREAARTAHLEFEQFGLSGFEDRYPDQLSGGMRQRVAFVRTILGGQSSVLLDEPFGSLDALTRMQAQIWLSEAINRDRRSVVLVTHDVEEALFLADRILVLSSRPGTIIDEVVVAATRPRDRHFLLSEEFADQRIELLDALGVLTQPVSGL